MKLSVALCTYNGEKYIQEQLDSIINQTIAVNEIIICDDCSKDGTVALINTYKEKFPEIFNIHINEENLRSNKNFEKAISLCTGDYIFLSDQDDIWKPEKVAKTLAVFEANPTAMGVFSNASFIDDYGNEIYDEITLWESVCFFEKKESPNLYESLINLGNFLTGATLCIKKETKSFCLPFQTIDTFIHDEWFAYCLSKRNVLFFTEEKLLSYRLHTNQQLGVGEIQDAKNKKDRNENHNKLILGRIEPRKFRHYKALSRAYFYQFEKYYTLYKKYNEKEFYDVSEILKQKYLAAELEMKKSNLLLYLIRKYKDIQKNRRQLPE